VRDGNLARAGSSPKGLYELGTYIFEVIWLYARCCGLYFAYCFTKIFVAQNRSSANASLKERIIRYACCVAICAAIGYVASGHINDRCMIVFLANVIAVLFGAQRGFELDDKTAREFNKPSHDNDDV